MRYLLLLFLLALSGCASHRSFDSNQDIKPHIPHYAAIENGRLEYYQFGHGTPVVLITGYATDVTSWDKRFLTALAKKHQLIIFNNRNVGDSYISSSRYASQDLAKDTAQLIRTLHLKKPALIGISMGGMIAQQVAVLYPNTIGQLILINTAIAGKQAIHPSSATEKTMLNMPTSQLGRFMIAVKLFFPASQRIQMAYALIFNRFLPAHYVAFNPTSVMAQQRSLLLQWMNDNATAKKLARLNLPTLVLNGTADAVIPPANSLILANTIRHAELNRWKNGGHAMIYQFPDGIAQAINNFIARN